MQIITGTPGSPGIVIGRAYHVHKTKAEVVYQQIIGPGQVVGQLYALDEAVKAAEKKLTEIKVRLEKDLPSQVLLIEAHLMMLRDQAFLQTARRLIEEEMVTASWAVVTAARQIAQEFEKIDDPYLRNRIEDIEAVADLVLNFLSGHRRQDLSSIREKAILIAHHLSPADTTQLDLNRVLGFVTEIGGRTSHTAIVARALGLPAVVGLEKATSHIKSGGIIILDATNGRVVIDPDEQALVEYQDRQHRFEVFLTGIRRKSHLPAATTDGKRLTVMANIEHPDEVATSLEQGAEGIGLFRTEFLYLSQRELPDEEQLYSVYRQVVEVMNGLPVTIRTLDLGGDKFSHHFDLVPEMNPAMGLRAVRLCLRRPDIFEIQLKAILRSSAHGPVRIMFPMISGVQEWRSCMEIVNRCREELRSKRLAFDEGIKIGCMMEVPSAVLLADLLARYVDFFSIGTNDLIQYSLAIDRVNEYVAHMYKPYHPAVLRMIEAVIKVGRKRKLPVSMCGEMAAEPGAVPLLVGMGLSEVSVNPQAVPWVKQVIRTTPWPVCAKLAKKAMGFETEDEISRFVHAELNRRIPETFGPDGLMLY